MHKLLPFILVGLLAACPASAADVQRLLYVADNPSGVSIYDINDRHRLVRKIEVPESGWYKGICASPQLERLYLSSNINDQLICIDLATDKVLWRKTYGGYVDSMAITPDGQTIYLPCRHDGAWWVIRAKDGSLINRIETGRGKMYESDKIGDFGPHNTWCSPDGSRMYLEVLTVPYVFIADTRTHRIIGKSGPFSRGVRPFTVSDDEKHIFANVDLLLGFEVARARNDDGTWGGPVIARMEARTPAARIEQIKNPPARKPHSTPSHGINITPDQNEIWVVDGVYGYCYVYDVSNPAAPRHRADVPIFENPAEFPRPGWISFSIDGRYAYPDGGAVIDTRTRKIVSRIPTTEKLLEVQFEDGKPVKAGHR